MEDEKIDGGGIIRRGKHERHHYVNIRLNKAEKDALNEYLKSNKIRQRSPFIREILMRHINFNNEQK